MHAEASFLQFMGQHINTEITLSAESPNSVIPSLSLRIYVEHYLIC